MNVRAIVSLTLVALFAFAFVAPVAVQAQGNIAEKMGENFSEEANSTDVGNTGPLQKLFTTIFQFGSMILKMLLGIFALWKAGEIAYHGADRIADFAYVALAFLLYFMLPYVYSLAKNLGTSFN